jgi:L,D-transpeptidase YcbB
MYFLCNTTCRSLFFVFVTLCASLTFTAVSAQAIAANSAIYDVVTQAGKGAKGIQAFYASTNYKPIWIGSGNYARRKALIGALKVSGDHGLPTARYKIAELAAALKVAGNGRNAAAAEMLATRIYLQYAQNISSGIVDPKRIDSEMALVRPRRKDQDLLVAIAKKQPAKFLESLAPKSREYQRLLSEKKKLEREMDVTSSSQSIPLRTLKLGSSGDSVILLRQRLTALGYGDNGAKPKFDKDLKATVIKFQKANGLNVDGVAGAGTIGRLNQGVKQKMIKVLVNLERERWLNFARGPRNVFVNLASYTVYLIDDGRATFQTRAVVGKRREFKTPEFNDEMTHMVINPTWYVPRSIAGKEYLPIIRKDPSFLARRNMVMSTSNGKAVNPASVDLSKYTANTFPYSIRQRPDPQNALGRVKFMLPNRFNIYLHDTPSKNLFNRDVRAFSHGCVRLQKPFEFAYRLLEKQTANPKTAFNTWLKTGKEKYVNLEKPVPVYISYRTVYYGNATKPTYYPDIYGRDKKVFNALSKAGVSLRMVQG